MTYDEMIAAWRDDPEQFWAAQAEAIDWNTPYKSVVDLERPAGRWFAGGTLNTCYNAVDRHADGGRGDQPALVFESAMTGREESYSYNQLRDNVAVLAGALVRAGVGTGDRVLIYMPMIPEAVFAMLACARIGAVHSVVFGGFAGPEVATRIDDAEPTAILSASCGLEPGRIVHYKPMLDEALQIASHQPPIRVVLQRDAAPCELTDADTDWGDFIDGAAPVDCVPVRAEDPLYLLYTSGTTGAPKGVVRDNGGHAVALTFSMAAIYGIDAGDVFWAASDIGWVVGHSYIVYGPLLAGATTFMFEGKPVGTPDAGVFWRLIDKHRINVMFTAPTAIRAIRREDGAGEHVANASLGHFKTLFLAGERCDPETLQWAERMLKVPVIDHWWQTETGWAIAGNMAGAGLFPVRAGSAGKPMPGWAVEILDNEGEAVAAGDSGAIACRLPLGPGATAGLWNADQRFIETYLTRYPGYYQTGDAGHIDADGYLHVMSRTDDVINVAGHRLSTGALEEVIAMHPDVAECAVTGVNDALKGQVPFGFVCLRSGADADPTTVVADCIQQVRSAIGPVAAFRSAIVVQRLPKTRSGKILRSTLAKIVNAEPYTVPATIDDPAILNEIAEVVATLRSQSS
ncbi:MAG: AMP-binding protein [Pseudomonadota bacterium]